MKNRVKMSVEKLRPNVVPEKHILVDFITKLMISRDYNSILVVYDRFLKISHFIVTTEKIMVEGLARLFRNNIIINISYNIGVYLMSILT